MTRQFLLMIVILSLTGCATRQARITASALRPQVETYSAAVEEVKKAEVQFYKETAAEAQKIRENLLENGVVDLRVVAARTFADLLAEEPMRNVTISKVFDFLKAASDAELSLYKELSARIATARTDFLKGIGDLAAHSAEIDIVADELVALSETKRPIAVAKEIGDFLKETAENVEKKMEKRKAGQ